MRRASYYDMGYKAGYSGNLADMTPPYEAAVRGRNLFMGGLYDGELQRKLEAARAAGDEQTIAYCEHNQRRRARGG